MKTHYAPIILLFQREQFWARVKEFLITPAFPVKFSRSSRSFLRQVRSMGGGHCGWRSPVLAGYVAIVSLLLLGTTGISGRVELDACGRIRQRDDISTGDRCDLWGHNRGLLDFIRSSRPPSFFTTSASSATGTPTELQLTHNYLLLTHITLIAFALSLCDRIVLREISMNLCSL